MTSWDLVFSEMLELPVPENPCEKAYTEPHRHYHTLSHIEYMEEELDYYSLGMSPPLILAIWFHDYVYIPGSSMNELDSGKAAFDFLDQAKVPDYVCQEVQQLVFSTREGPEPANWNQAVLHDLDYSILGCMNPKTYDEYAANVRKEFSDASDDQWRAGRRLFLEKLAEKDHLFYTAQFRSLEQYAGNINRELESLK